MDTISSAEFRKRYAKLTQPTRVTALGRVIGEWTPVGFAPVEVISFDGPLTQDQAEAVKERFSTRPFTPVPKRTKR